MFQKSVKMHKLAFLFSTFSQQFQKLFQKSVKMHKLACLLSIFSQQFQHRFKLHQNAPYSGLIFIFSPRSSIFKKHRFEQCWKYQLASLISNFLSSFNFQNIVSKSAGRNRLASLISIFLNIFLSLSGKYFQGENPSSLHIPISSKFYFAHAMPLMHEQQMYCMETLTRHS